MATKALSFSRMLADQTGYIKLGEFSPTRKFTGHAATRKVKPVS